MCAPVVREPYSISVACVLALIILSACGWHRAVSMHSPETRFRRGGGKKSELYKKTFVDELLCRARGEMTQLSELSGLHQTLLSKVSEQLISTWQPQRRARPYSLSLAKKSESVSSALSESSLQSSSLEAVISSTYMFSESGHAYR